MLQRELEINWIFNQFFQISLVLMASCLMDRNTDVMPILITDVPKLALCLLVSVNVCCVKEDPQVFSLNVQLSNI